MALQTKICKQIGTSQDFINRSYNCKSNSFSSEDSGYISFTPHSTKHEFHSKIKLFSGKKFRNSRFQPYSSKSYYKPTNLEPDVYHDFSKNIPDKLNVDYPKSHLTVKNSKFKYIRNSFKMELRSYCKKQKALKKSPFNTITHTSNSFCDALFSSPLIAIPLLPIHCGKTMDTRKIKVIVPQSTPCVIDSSILSSSLYNADFSPINYTKNHFDIDSFKKLSNISNSEYVCDSLENQPKKLDFSKHAIFKSFQKKKSAVDYTGKDTIDILKLLGEKSNYPKIISKILNYLNPKDLCSISMVSKSWMRICISDDRAQERRLKYIKLRQYSKENRAKVSKQNVENIQTSPKTRHPRRGFLTAVPNNLLQEPRPSLTPNSPPVSPSKVIFHSFIKAGRSLAPYDQLVPCPNCKFACLVKTKSIGTCSRQSCPMEEFCLFCSSKLHTGELCQVPLLATPTKRGTNQHLVGTKECKRNLRRLSRLI